METRGTELLIGAWRLLTQEEREEAYEQLTELRLQEQAGLEGETALMLRSLLAAAEHIHGGEAADARPAVSELTVEEYRRASQELRDAERPIEPVSRVIRFFGSWRRAREALQLSESNTARRIEGRFRYRRLGKVWRYTDETLEAALHRCAAEDCAGRAPSVAEYEWWRQRQLELARAAGDDALHLPSPTPYRKCWGSWEAALERFGFTPQERAARLDPSGGSGG